MGKMGKGEWKIQASSYGMNKPQQRSTVHATVRAMYGDRWQVATLAVKLHNLETSQITMLST